MQFLSKSVEETSQIASNFLNNLSKSEKVATVIGLYGELGAGKTTFMKAVALYFGIKETIQSPTFVIMRNYSVAGNQQLVLRFNKLIHIDAYRIEREEEMINLRWKEIITNPENIIFVEWPEKIEGIMPPHTKIFFEHGGGESERKIKIEY